MSADQITTLKNAIATLENQRATLGETVVKASIAALQKQLAELETQLPPVEQQRKQTTILFTDIAGHTNLIQGLDPEENMEIIDQALVRMTAPVEGQSGHVARYTGDGFKAIFGMPTAHENDPERAIRAGLGIIEVAQTYARELEEKHGLKGFNVRVGIDTGLTVIGGVTEAEDTIKGLVVNLAARLESAAPPGGVLISHNTYQHVRGIFDVQPLEPIHAKGFPEPVPVYLVLRAKPRAFRVSTRGVEGVETRMIGRDAEFTRLQTALKNTLETRPQMITLSGEAGVGKSRLLYEFENWLEHLPDPIYLFKGRAIEETQTTPYALLRNVFAFRFEIQDCDAPEVVRQKFETGIAAAFLLPAPAPSETSSTGHAQAQRCAHFIGQLLGFDFSTSPYLQGVLDDTQQLRDRARRYLGEYFQAIATQAPLILLLEDLHWADETSLDWLLHLVGGMMHSRLLVVSNARPVFFERRPTWGEGLPVHQRLALEPLSRQDSRALVAEIMKKAAQVPLILRELIVGGAEGNAFYIEELIKMLIEDGVILKGENEWQVEPTRLLTLDVPPTLTGVLQARLDSLPPLERMILQQASVVGHIFWHEVICRINTSTAGGTDAQELARALQTLEQKEMIFRRRTSNFAGNEYIFKHSILRSVTYESVLKRLRRVYHLLVAEWLIEQSGARAAEFTGMIADHLERAGETAQAVTYLRRAGEKAARQYANEEAIQFLTRALALLPEADAPADLCTRFDMLLTRTEVFNLKGAREAQQQDLATLAELAERLDDNAKRAEVALLRALTASAASQYAVVMEAGEEAIRLGAGIARIEAKAHLLWGRAWMSQGDYPAAQGQFEQAFALAQGAAMVQIEAESCRHLGMVAERVGDPARAIENYERALQQFQAIGDRRGEGHTLNQLGNIRMSQGDYARGQACYEQFLTICREIGDRWGEGLVIRDIADGYLERANLSGASAYFQQALQITREIGNRTIEGGALAGLGNISLAQSDYTRAQAYFEQSLTIARGIGNRPMEAKTLVDIGRFFHRQGDYLRAQNYYRQGLQLIRGLGNRMGEAQVLAFLALVASQLGNFEEAETTGQQAYHLAQDLGHRAYEALAATSLGHARMGLGRVDEAAQMYQHALDLYRTRLSAAARATQVLEPLAGLAHVSLCQNDLANALPLVDEILHTLAQALAPVDSPVPDPNAAPHDQFADLLPMYWICWQVLNAAQDPRAADVLITAQTLLAEQAAKIEDLDLRHAFLNYVAVNRAIQRCAHESPTSCEHSPL